MKPRVGFYYWLIFLPALIVVQHFRLRPFPHIVVLFWLLIPLASIVWLRWTTRRVRVSMPAHLPAVERRRPFALSVDVTNPFRLHEIQVTTHPHDRPRCIAPAATADFVLPSEAPHVGLFYVPEEPLYLSDPFRLFYAPIPLSPVPVTVHPSDANAPVLFAESIGEQRSAPNHRITRRPGETAYVEPLQTGQPVQHIHWSLSARMQHWMVRRFEKEEEDTCLLIADPPTDADTADLLYDRMAAVGRDLLADGFSVRVASAQTASETFRRPEALSHLRTAIAYAAAFPASRQEENNGVLPGTRRIVYFCDALTNERATAARAYALRVPHVAVVSLQPASEEGVDALRKDGILVFSAEVAHA